MDNRIILRRVCVAGGSGRIGSSLVRKLLERGHTVHATVRNLCEPERTAPLKGLPGADTRLFLFEADFFEAHQFEQAIRGCEFVFLVAFPTRPIEGRDAREAVLTAQESILGACERSGTVRRLIYTGSTAAASPLEEDGLRFRDFLDESCWTSLDLPPILRSHEAHDHFKFYISVKAEAERQLMNYVEHREGKNSVEVAILTCGVVGGEALGDKTAGVGALVSPITGDAAEYGCLKFVQDQLCSVPLVHLDDVCEAHLFCMGVPLSSGRRFLCATAYPSLWEILAYYRQHYPDLLVTDGDEPPDSRRVTGGSSKLRDMGFHYKYGMEETIEDSVRYANKLGLLNHS